MDTKTKYLITLMIILVSYSILVYGEFKSDTQIQIFPMVFRLDDPNYLVNDWYTNSVDTFNPRTFYVHLVHYTNQIFDNFRITYLLLFILVFSAIYINFFYLAEFFFKDPKKSFFIALLSLIAITFSLDGTDITKLVLTPATMGWLFSIMSFNLYFRGKNKLAFLLAGIASMFQIVIGSITFALFMGDIILRRPLISKKKFIKILESAAFFPLYLLNVIPLLIINAKTTNVEISKLSAYIAGWFTHSGHVIPSSWGLKTYIIFLMFVVFFFLAVWKSKIDLNYKKTILNFCIVVLTICFIGYFFVEIIPISSIVKMQLFRATIIINILGYVFIGNYIYDRIKNAVSLEKIFFMFLPLAFISQITFLILVPVFLFTEGLKLLNLDLFKRLDKEKIIFGLVGLLVGIIFWKNFSNQIMNFWPTTTHTTIAYLIAPLIFYFLGLLLLKIKKSRKIITLLIVLGTVFIFVYYSPLERQYLHSQEKTELFNFIKSNTPKDTILLTPLRAQGFRLNSERALVTDLFCFPYTDSGIINWYKRIQDLSNNHIKNPKTSNIRKAKEYYHTLTKSDLLRLQKKYKFSYVIFEKPKELELTKAFENQKYVVYKI